MEKENTIARIKQTGIVAVIRAASADEARRIAEACVEGGISAVELTFTVPGADRVIESLAGYFSKNGITVGAGTVLDSETARIAILCGAEFIVSPMLSADIMRLCNRYRIPAIPGIQTITEAVSAMELGADIIKLFPGDLYGPSAIKAINGPLPQAQIMPTGGVDLSNVDEWIAAGAVAVGVGGALTSGSKTGDYKSIAEKAKGYVEKIKRARLGQ